MVEVTAREDPACLPAVEAESDGDGVGAPVARLQQALLEGRVALAGDDDLPTGPDDGLGGGQHQVDTLLVNQPGHQAEKRTAADGQAELLAQVIGILALFLPEARREGLHQVRTRAGVPTLIDPAGQSLAPGAAAVLPPHPCSAVVISRA